MSKFLYAIPILFVAVGFVGLFGEIGRLNQEISDLSGENGFLSDENENLREQAGWFINTTNESGYIIPWDTFTDMDYKEIDQIIADEMALRVSISVNNIINKDGRKGDFKSFYDQYFGHYSYTTAIDKMYPTHDYVQTPREFLIRNIQGDCDDSAMFLSTIAKVYGERVRVAVGTSWGSGHAWLQIFRDGEWLDVDSTSHRICQDCVSSSYTVSVAYAEVG